jgi:TRAP transporter TAXI family solute receptor
MSNNTTRGAVEDLRLIEAKKADFGLGVAGLVLKALRGEKPYKKKYGNLRGMGPATVSMFQMATFKSSGITSLSQLNGKAISSGRKGGNAHYMTGRVIKHAGLKVRREYMNFSALADAMKDNRIQAFSIPLPVPGPAFLKASTAAPIRLLPIQGGVLKKMLKDNPAYFPVDIPAGSYNGIDKDVPTVGYTAWTVVGAHVPPDVVYEVTRINFSKRGRDYLPKVHKGWVAGLKVAPALGQMAAVGMKIHPGAKRYWEEKRHDVPASIW